jgi:hypothetical protein
MPDTDTQDTQAQDQADGAASADAPLPSDQEAMDEPKGGES